MPIQYFHWIRPLKEKYHKGRVNACTIKSNVGLFNWRAKLKSSPTRKKYDNLLKLLYIPLQNTMKNQKERGKAKKKKITISGSHCKPQTDPQN